MAASADPLLTQGSPSVKIRLAIAFYSVAGCAFLIALILTMIQHPLVPFQLDSADWASAWLITTIGDYAATASCLCGIVLFTESTYAGLAWSFAMFCLGSVFSCAYMIYRSVKHESLSLREAKGGLMKVPVVGIFIFLGIAFGAAFTVTTIKYPLAPVLLNDAAWSSAWLLTTIGDYYVQSLCLCAIIFATEDFKSALAWSCGILFLGSGFSCGYMVWRCFKYGTLQLTSLA